MDLNRLKAQLLTSGLQQKDPPLYQVINSLIQQVEGIIASIANIAISGGSSTTIIQSGVMGPPGMMGNDGEDGLIGPPGAKGEKGDIGATGVTGPTTIGPMGLNGEDGLMGFPIPGSKGDKGDMGATGAQGVAGPLTIGPMGLNGEDGLMGFPIPGPPGKSALSDWEGKIVACFGDGNPNFVIRAIQVGVTSPTPTNITTSLARCSYFKLRKAITVANIRWYGINNLTAVYHIAIYRASDDARMSSDNNPNTTVDSWNAVADSFTLQADVLYYAAVSVDTTGATAGIVAFGGALAQTTGAIKVVPGSWPGNLIYTAGYVDSAWLGQATVTTGALPNPGNTPVVIGTWAGGMPAIFLDAA